MLAGLYLAANIAKSEFYNVNDVVGIVQNDTSHLAQDRLNNMMVGILRNLLSKGIACAINALYLKTVS